MGTKGTAIRRGGRQKYDDNYDKIKWDRQSNEAGIDDDDKGCKWKKLGDMIGDTGNKDK